MDDFIHEIYENVRLNEGISRLKSFFILLYLHGSLSVKELSLRLKLPVPVVAAVKNECKKRGAVAVSANGIGLTDAGLHYVREALRYGAVNTSKLRRVLDAPALPECWPGDFRHEIELLDEIYRGRPDADVTVDQSLCDAETGIKRALLMLRCGGLIGRRVLFAGDDDLTSVAAGLVLQSLSDKTGSDLAEFTVLDLDDRVLHYIEASAPRTGVRVNCVKHDLRHPVPEEHRHRYDAVFTDPPYTLPGLTLFAGRGLEALKQENDLYVYLSCAHKDPVSRLGMQRMFGERGLIIEQIYEGFNRYHGAQILGGVSDLYVLAATGGPDAPLNQAAFYDGPIYTNEANRSIRLYMCKNCRTEYRVGYSEKITTVEILKKSKCAECGGETFLLREKQLERDKKQG